jgi:protein SCO1/2
MMHARARRPGLAVIALVAIGVITMTWWALALWPVGSAEPEWLSRTRAACFGAAPGGLPDAGGWILLVGQPAGMLGLLIAIWRDSLRAELRRIRESPAWLTVGSGFAVAVMVFFAVLGLRATRAYASARVPPGEARGVPTRLDIAAPAVTLTDQNGRRVSFADFRGHPALITFAFGHCVTVCPTIVRDVAAARRGAHRADVRLVVVTVDPWRDTPDRLPSLASHWELAPGDRVLSGAVPEVQAALDALGIGRRRNESTGEIEHGGTVMLLDAAGRIAWRLDGGWSRLKDLPLGR